MTSKAVKRFDIHTNNIRTKSVSKPIAQTTTLCDRVNVLDTITSNLEAAIYSDSSIPNSLKCLIEILSTSGCRVSQALQIKGSQISLSGRILIKAVKGGNDTIIQISKYKSFLISQRTNNNEIFDIYNRFFVYRFLKKKGIFFKFQNSSKTSVTHFFRHALAVDVNNLSHNANLIASSLGHKSLNSQKYYMQKK